MGTIGEIPVQTGERPAGAGGRASATSLSRLAAPAVSLAILISAIALGVIAQGVVRDQADELLRERASELSAVLSVSISDARSNLRVSALAAASASERSMFDAIAGQATLNGSSTVVLRDRSSGPVTIASAGPDATAVGKPIDPVASSAVSRARRSTDLVAEIVERAGTRHVILAVAVPDHLVAYTDTPLKPATPAPSAASSPYRELNVAVYAASKPDRHRLVFVSGDEPGSGEKVVRRPLKIGSDSWIITASAREPLVGTVAAFFPKLVVGTGFVLACFIGLLVAILARRRAYALRLVAERTESLREAQLAAEHANQAKSEFLSRMSHELRTPLNAVMGFAQLLEMDALTDDQRENVEQIGRGGTHLLDLINEILDISRIESGRMSLSLEPVSVRDVVEAAASLVGPLAEEGQVQLLTRAEDLRDVTVRADRQRLKQILLNLLSNGIKYNHVDGSVRVSCFEDSPGRLRIEVKDTGPGIPAEQRHLLFMPFERLGAEHTAVEGTGVGLALSLRLAEAMDCHLGFEPSPEGGSIFWVDLPLADPAATDVGPDEPDAQSATIPAQQVRVLHIEDNPSNLALVERALSRRPVVAVIAANQGLTGLDLARQHHPALVLLDLNLADVPGDEILTRLRQDPATADIPVVVVSADAMPQQIQRLMALGAAAYLTKPIDIRQLLEVVDHVIARATATRPVHADSARTEPTHSFSPGGD